MCSLWTLPFPGFPTTSQAPTAISFLWTGPFDVRGSCGLHLYTLSWGDVIHFIALSNVSCWQFPNPPSPALISCQFSTNTCQIDISTGCSTDIPVLHATKNYCFSSTYFTLHSPSTPYLGRWYHHSTRCSSQTLLSLHVTISKAKVILWVLSPTSDYQLFSYHLSPSHNGLFEWLLAYLLQSISSSMVFLKYRPEESVFLFNPSPSHHFQPSSFPWLPRWNQHIAKTYKALHDAAPASLYSFSPSTPVMFLSLKHPDSFLSQNIHTCYRFYLEWPYSRCLYGCLLSMTTLF